MAHRPAPASGSLSEEAFLADRERFWHGWTKFTVAAVIFLIVLLVLMAIFLL